MAANIITLIRVLVAPLFVYTFIYSTQGSNIALMLWLSFAILLIIELSDAFDGHVARTFNQVSDFGKLFDPFADSLSRLTIFVSFLVVQMIPVWMFLVFLYRDLFVAALRLLCLKNNRVVAARLSGKLKAIFQAIGSFVVLGVLFAKYYEISWVPQSLFGKNIGYTIMFIPMLVTFYSAIDYWMGSREVINKKSNA